LTDLNQKTNSVGRHCGARGQARVKCIIRYLTIIPAQTAPSPSKESSLFSLLSVYLKPYKTFLYALKDEPMQIDLPSSVVKDLQKLLRDLSSAYAECEESTYQDIFFDTQESGDSNSDPQTFMSINKDTLVLAKTIKQKLHM
jgi:hypothetical protein